MTRFDGILLVDKPGGMTSADVVRVVKKQLRCKTGHLGTLDPFATGLLPLCLGEGTKIAPFLSGLDKTYEGTIRLGSATDTGDGTGSVTRTAPLPSLPAAELADVAAAFEGDRDQVPPMYSAVRQAGVRLYELARQGLEVHRDARRIRVERLELSILAPDLLWFRVHCSKGTYVRVLAEEVAEAMGTVGHLETLRRTRFGSFDVSEAIPLDTLASGCVRVLGLREALRGVRERELTPSGCVRVRQGYAPFLATLPVGGPGELAKLVDPDGHLVAVVAWSEDDSGWRYARVFAANHVESAETVAASSAGWQD